MYLKRKWFWLLPLMVTAVAAFDLTCTLGALHEGTLVELNPLMRVVIAKTGSIGLVAFKVVVTVCVSFLLAWALRAYSQGRFAIADHGRVRTVVMTGQAVIVLAHGALVSWWLLWFLY